MATAMLDDIIGFVSAGQGSANYRTAGGITLPTLGVGCWSFGSKSGEYWGERKNEDDFAVVRQALEQGFTYFDTAEAYNNGASEEVLARALAESDTTNKAIVGSKVLPSNCFPDKLRESFQNSLDRLNRESMDLYMIHWPLNNISVPKGDIPSLRDALMTLKSLQDEGKVKHIGVSNFGIRQLEEAVAVGVKIAVNQVMYNLLSRAIEFEVLPFCQANDIAVIAYSPLMQGLLTNSRCSLDGLDDYRTRTRQFSGSRPKSRHGGDGVEEELALSLAKIKEIATRESRTVESLALAWCIATPGVTTVIAGARNVSQFNKNVQAAVQPLSDALKNELDEVTDDIKQKLGPYIDYYQGVDQQRSF